MKNIALKLTKEDVFAAVRIQHLLDTDIFPDGEFENPESKKIYNEARYFHRKQKGLIRISKYVFSGNFNFKRKCLTKHDLKIDFSELNYDYGLGWNNMPQKDFYNSADSSDTKIWYVNFAAKNAFTEWGEDSHSQEAGMIREMPLLYKACRFLDSGEIMDSSLIHKNDQNVTIITPILFEGIPQWVNCYGNSEIAIPFDKKNNILSMMAPFGGKGIYNENEIIFLLLTLFSGFGGIIKRAQKDRVPFTEIHTGNWGCGNMRNNKKLIYLAQIFAANVLGIDRIVFHNIDKEKMNNALEKWKNFPECVSFTEAVQIFLKYGFKWR